MLFSRVRTAIENEGKYFALPALSSSPTAWLLMPNETRYRVFSHDVTAAMFVSQNNETAAMLVSQNNETAAMLVSQTNPVGVELFSYANVLFCSNKFAYMLAT